MPINNPSVINQALYEFEEDGTMGYYCDECLVRLFEGESEEYLKEIREDHKYEAAHGEGCTECRAFNERRHPAMFSDKRTIKEIEQRIAEVVALPNIDDEYDAGKADGLLAALQWVLGKEEPPFSTSQFLQEHGDDSDPFADAEQCDECTDQQETYCKHGKAIGVPRYSPSLGRNIDEYDDKEQV